MAAFDTSALVLHPLDYRLHGTPVLYLRRTYLVEDAETLEHDGYQVVRIDGSSWKSESDAHNSIAESLAFPDYYGHNLNALHDCLRDVAAYDYGADPSATGTLILLDNAVNPPGVSGDSDPWEGWSHVSQNVKEVPGRVA